jgi:Spy/CpxP family protein refolding chaperone
MRTAVQIIVVVASVSAVAYAQTGQSAYTGQEKREIKALSAEEIKAYQEGQGMGFAKAAELNEYPGPKHVLELATQLKLSDQQKAETQKIYDRMHAQATQLGASLIARERELDQLFASKQIDPNKLRQSVAEIARLQGELRVAHLQAHLETRRALSPEQIEKYDQLRGYNSGGEHKDHQHKH